MTRVTIIAALITGGLMVVSCRDDSDGDGSGGSKSGCQSCVDDYCDCVDGVSDLQEIQSCSESTQKCMADKCTEKEALDIDYTNCSDNNGAGSGSKDNSNKNNSKGSAPGTCQYCVDEYCNCADDETDMEALADCAETYYECSIDSCTEEEISQVDFDACGANTGANSDPAACQACINSVCSCMESTETADQALACLDILLGCEAGACAGVSESELDGSCMAQYGL